MGNEVQSDLIMKRCSERAWDTRQGGASSAGHKHRQGCPIRCSAVSRLIRQLARETGSKSPVTNSTCARISDTRCCILSARQAKRTLGLLSYSMRPGLFHAAASCVIEDLIVARGSETEELEKAACRSHQNRAARKVC